jgi:hypothetical protein
MDIEFIQRISRHLTERWIEIAYYSIEMIEPDHSAVSARLEKPVNSE